jgi:hypothetical protein
VVVKLETEENQQQPTTQVVLDGALSTRSIATWTMTVVHLVVSGA